MKIENIFATGEIPQKPGVYKVEMKYTGNWSYDRQIGMTRTINVRVNEDGSVDIAEWDDSVPPDVNEVYYVWRDIETGKNKGFAFSQKR